MATVEAPSRPPPAPDDGQRLLLHAVDWATYEKLGDVFRDRSGLRLTYNHGKLEIMTLSHRHERLKMLLGRLVVTLTEEFKLPIVSSGSVTCKREDLDSGFEPDQCFYIQHAARMQTVQELDLRRDPPPDLAIEVDITHSSLDRQQLYASMGVPELWRYRNETVAFFQLQADGSYAPTEHSRAFPRLRAPDLTRFLQGYGKEEENAYVRSFREWARRLAEGTA